jgi:hypothetical protein
MLEYVAYALLGLVMIGGLVYVTTCSEAEEPPRADQPAPARIPDNLLAPGAGKNK